MKRELTRSGLSLLLVLACSASAGAATPKTQENFGVQMAKMNLWREAMFRFQRAVEINPGDAMAHNNLAVAYEANGDFEKARKEYLEALKLDKSNQYIQKNYSRFVEFTSRNKKRQGAQVPKTASSPALTPSGAVATRTPAPPQPGMPADPADPNAPPAAGQPSSGPPSPPRTAPPSDLPPPPAKPPGGAL